jgi:hypothetical protein
MGTRNELAGREDARIVRRIAEKLQAVFPMAPGRILQLPRTCHRPHICVQRARAFVRTRKIPFGAESETRKGMAILAGRSQGTSDELFGC